MHPPEQACRGSARRSSRRMLPLKPYPLWRKKWLQGRAAQLELTHPLTSHDVILLLEKMPQVLSVVPSRPVFVRES
jgi:hypothetical protein